ELKSPSAPEEPMPSLLLLWQPCDSFFSDGVAVHSFSVVAFFAISKNIAIFYHRSSCLSHRHTVLCASVDESSSIVLCLAPNRSPDPGKGSAINIEPSQKNLKLQKMFLT
ncbi:hypothetical protein PIB30_078035, partial [Stylosanthes scabra]|nr:hypothetical protein [Stylosanthes scabra]